MKPDTLTEACNYVKEIIGNVPENALVLGSGLGKIAEELEDPTVIEYSSIKGFPLSTAPGHASRLICGFLNNIPLLVFQGRFHLYEGYNPEQIAYPYRLLKKLGCKRLFLSNAAGGINRSYKPGDIMILKDHINFTNRNPLRGSSFNDMSRAYSPFLQSLMLKAASNLGLNVKKGTYGWTSGPSFETAAEIQMMRILGADAVGMSTVPEVITAVDEGLEIGVFSCISNMACGILDQPITVQEVMENGVKMSDSIYKLICEVLRLLQTN